jgi:hypothetical protein
VHVKYVVRGATVGTGTALTYDGKVYVPLGAVQKLTGTSASWDAKTSTVAAGAAPVTSVAPYLEDLSGQPYYVSSAALCWQYTKDGKPSPMHSFVNSGSIGYPCNLSLPGAPTMLGQHYAHEMSVLVSANASKAVAPSNTVVTDFDLGGKYKRLTGTVGLADSPFNRVPMDVGFRADGKTIFATELSPGAVPRSFKLDVSHIQQLTLFVANVSGGAPHWDTVLNYQYDPGAVVFANTKLSSS